MKKLFAALLTALSFSAFAQTQAVPVLMYHEIVSNTSGIAPNDLIVTVDTFNAQMKWLRTNGYVTLTASQLAQYMANPTTVRIPAGKKAVVITFDDGWTNQQNALPGLSKNGFKGTFNIIADAPTWGSTYLSWNQIRNKLVGAGHEIASHTKTHPEGMTAGLYFDEITGAKGTIERQIKRTVKTIAWPYGYFTDDMTAYAVSSNFIGAQTVDQGWCYKNNISLEGTPLCNWAGGNAPYQDPFLMKRMFVDGRCTLVEFKLYMERGWASPCDAPIAAPALLSVTPAAVLPTTMRQPSPKHVHTARDDVDDSNDGEDHGHGDDRAHKVRNRR
jgi:peptidoglycan/xylan/chitin deacetylase (PgdA/CDA1 family)